MNAKGRAVPAAYSDTGALGVACPHCGAGGGEPCTKTDGRTSRVPCVDRLAAADIATPVLTTAVDFSEPRRSQGVD